MSVLRKRKNVVVVTLMLVIAMVALILTLQEQVQLSLPSPIIITGGYYVDSRFADALLDKDDADMEPRPNTDYSEDDRIRIRPTFQHPEATRTITTPNNNHGSTGTSSTPGIFSGVDWWGLPKVQLPRTTISKTDDAEKSSASWGSAIQEGQGKADDSSTDDNKKQEPFLNYDVDAMWNDLPPNIQEAATTLGYNALMWNYDEESDASHMCWYGLADHEQAAAKELGYDGAEKWDEDDCIFGVAAADAAEMNDEPSHSSSSSSSSSNITVMPNVTWLMSFPNSGTSYTMANIRGITQRATATNYEKEAIESPYFAVPRKDRNDQVYGPWYEDIGLPLPSKRVLCKTHCIGYNDRSPLQRSVHSQETFFAGCRRSIKHAEEHRYYKTDGFVDSVVHLIRDPIDNIVSRMHLGLRLGHLKGLKKLTAEELDAFMGTEQAVTDWCQALDTNFWGKKPSQLSAATTITDTDTNNASMAVMKGLTKEALSAMRKLPFDLSLFLHVPCHSEFFRYTQWHNLAVELVKAQKLPTLTVYFEDYELAYNQTVDRMVDFLGQTWATSAKESSVEFVPGKTYRNAFFGNETQHNIKLLIEAIASNETWALLGRYFV